MSSTPWIGRSGRVRNLIAILVALWAIPGVANVKAQNFVSRPPSFQAPGGQSFERQILDRLTQTGQYEPDDLPNLIRLANLHSIAMLVDVRTDLSQTLIGNRLELDVTGLTQASGSLYESVSSSPQDLADIAQSVQLYEAVEENFSRVESTLGEFPGFSNQAADRLRRVTRLMAVVTPMMQELEASLPVTAPVPLNGSYELDALRRQTRSLANDLVEMIKMVSEPGEKRSGKPGVPRDLEELLGHVQGFQRTLSLRPSSVELEASIHALRRRCWRVEATINQLDLPAEVRSRWRRVMGRMNAISDDFGMPRVMVLAAPNSQPASVRLERPIARVYRGPRGVRSEIALK